MSQTTTTNIVLAGVGGQGILLASEIIARAAMAAGHDVKTNEVHGMAQRGGSVLAQIRYGPKVHSPLIPVGSSQTVIPLTVSSGTALYPAGAEARIRRTFPRLIYLDAVALAGALGNVRASNAVVLGALSTGLDLPAAAWQEAIRGSVKEKFLEVNRQAFAAGAAQARSAAAGPSTSQPQLAE